jgi:hypothetical protein
MDVMIISALQFSSEILNGHGAHPAVIYSTAAGTPDFCLHLYLLAYHSSHCKYLVISNDMQLSISKVLLDIRAGW